MEVFPASLSARLHVLINNAAQTITRPVGWVRKMAGLEEEALGLLSYGAATLLSDALPPLTCSSPGEPVSRVYLDESGQPLDLAGVNSWSRRLCEVSREELVHTMNVNAIAPFILMRKLRPVLAPPTTPSPPSPSTSTLVDAAKTVHPLLSSAGIVVNVTALEGKFNVGKKSSGHPHTNMAKAALNMLTLTCGREWARAGIFVSSVDTG